MNGAPAKGDRTANRPLPAKTRDQMGADLNGCFVFTSSASTTGAKPQLKLKLLYYSKSG